MGKSVFAFAGVIILCAIVLHSCANSKKNEQIPVIDELDFNTDSVFSFIQNQVNFGPRVPNSKNHIDCGNYLIKELSRFKADVIVQEATVSAYNGERLNIRNIIGRYNVNKKNRILLCAHWDTRPYADWDPDISKQNTPIDGADDGASGVAVLLETARQISLKNTTFGIDIIFFDAEDYGPPRSLQNPPKGNWWCLGSQYWAKHPHVPNYQANFGILLDMVSSSNATFLKEEVSVKYAASVVESIWSQARDLGYSQYFKDALLPNGITDDHLFVNTIANIPCIDIINTDMATDHGFPKHWHTHNDNISAVDINTLAAVGRTVLKIIY